MNRDLAVLPDTFKFRRRRIISLPGNVSILLNVGEQGK
jgi:hypothetical protein